MTNVTSPEWSKKLKEAWIEMEAEEYWSNIHGYWELVDRYVLEKTVPGSDGWTYLEEGLAKGNVYPALTVTELMEKMPTKIMDKDNLPWNLRLYKSNKGYFAEYHRHCSSDFHSTPQDALAQLFIYIKENGLV